MITLEELADGHCYERPSGSPTLSKQDVEERLALLPEWELAQDGKGISFTRRMQDFQAAIDFVVEVARLAEEQNHHPDIQVRSYRTLQLDLSTHSVGGLTDNDFIMAAKINLLRN